MTEINLTRKEEKDLLLKALFGSPFFNIFASVLATFIVGAIFLRGTGGVPIAVTSTTTEVASTFDVSAEGSVTVIPDEARVRMGVRKEGTSIAQIQEQVNVAMDQLSESLREMGIDERDIKTDSYSFNPRYGIGPRPDGYVAYAEVEVKVRDLGKVSEVLDLVGRLELEQVGGLTFGLSEKLEEETMRAARGEAVEEAKAKAEELAKLANMRLGKIVDLQESGSYPQPYVMRAEKMMTLDAVGEESVTPTPVEPGSSEISVSVTLSYEIL